MYKFLGTRAVYRAGQAGRGPAPGAGVASVPGTQWRGQCRRGRAQAPADFLRTPALCPRAGDSSSRWASASAVKREGTRVCLRAVRIGGSSGQRPARRRRRLQSGRLPPTAPRVRASPPGASAPLGAPRLRPRHRPSPVGSAHLSFTFLPTLILTVWLMGE